MNYSNSCINIPGDELGIYNAFHKACSQVLIHPWSLAVAQAQFGIDVLRLIQNWQLSLSGMHPAAIAKPDAADRRFRNELWETNPFADFMKQFYLTVSRHCLAVLKSTEGMDRGDHLKASFFTRQLITAMSPSNFAATNPEVWQEALRTGGRSLIQAWQNFCRDFDWKTGLLRTKQADLTAFELGKSIAATPGKVIHQTDLMQLIQFAPSTDTVLKRPLLIVPPWINKYYVLDLQPGNSFIKWATDQGHTVFVISWVNPDEKHSRKGFDAYISEGTLAALDAIERQTGEGSINAVGYCIGGTLLAATLGCMAGAGDTRIAGATFLTTMLDFAEPGEIEVFIDENAVSALERRMSGRGFLEGFEMASAFGLLRSQEFLWPMYISQYLMGKQPAAFDILYWNSDSTRMPYLMHSFYLRKMYLENLLKKPGGIELLGVPIDLSRVKIPCCFVSTIEDHIAPWKSTYAGARLLGGKVRFILGGSGHVAGIVNPPSGGKHGYRVNDRLPADPESWLRQSEERQGSWWTEWNRWTTELDAERVRARQDGNLVPIEDAPGSYCRVRLD